MKTKIKKWTLRLLFTVFLILGLLVSIILNPNLTYASKTVYKNMVIYHEKPLDNAFFQRLDKAVVMLEGSALYKGNESLEVCLNDGAFYPALMEAIRGKAFGWGFYNKVVLMGNADASQNFVEFNGYKWNLEQLLAHELIHCLQFNSYGFWGSNPVAGIEEWKWEGYPEYVSRKSSDQVNLISNIEKMLQAEKTSADGWVQFNDSTGTVLSYYKNRMLVHYCMEVKKMSFAKILEYAASEDDLRQEMLQWYDTEK